MPLDGCVLPLRRVAGRRTARWTRAALGMPPDAVVFATFVGVLKLSPRCLGAVARDPRRRARRGCCCSRRHATTSAPRYVRRLDGFGIAPTRVALRAVRPATTRDRARATRLVDVGARHVALHRRRHDGGRARRGRAGRHARRRAPRRADDVEPARASRRHRDDRATATTTTSRSPCGSRTDRGLARRASRAAIVAALPALGRLPIPAVYTRASKPRTCAR